MFCPPARPTGHRWRRPALRGVVRPPGALPPRWARRAGATAGRSPAPGRSPASSSPPDSVCPSWWRRSARAGNRGCPRHHGIGVLIAGCEGEVLLDGETGKTPFVLGDPDHARTVNPMARPTGDVTARGAPSPSRPDHSHHRLERCRLARPFRPSKHPTSPRQPGGSPPRAPVPSRNRRSPESSRATLIAVDRGRRRAPPGQPGRRPPDPMPAPDRGGAPSPGR